MQYMKINKHDMNIEELKMELLGSGIHHHCFGINEIKSGETWNIIKKNDIWEVIFSSRGIITERIEFEDEDAACQFMLNKVKKEFGIK